MLDMFVTGTSDRCDILTGVLVREDIGTLDRVVIVSFDKDDTVKCGADDVLQFEMPTTDSSAMLDTGKPEKVATGRLDNPGNESPEPATSEKFIKLDTDILFVLEKVSDGRCDMGTLDMLQMGKSDKLDTGVSVCTLELYVGI